MSNQALDAASRHFPTFLFTVGTCIWGFMLILPYDTFSIAHGYDILSATAPEVVWGSIWLILGLINLIGLVRENIMWVRRTSKALMLLWMFLAVAYAITTPASAAWPMWACLSIFFGWASVTHQERFYRRETL